MPRRRVIYLDWTPAFAGVTSFASAAPLPRCLPAPPYCGTFGSVLKMDDASEFSLESLGGELEASPL